MQFDRIESACRKVRWLPRLLAVVVVLQVLGAAQILAADDEPLPKADTILDKYVEVTGGKAAYAKITNRVAKGTLEIMGAGLKFDITVHVAAPNKSYSLMESKELGKIEKVLEWLPPKTLEFDPTRDTIAE
ncbi:MAG: hypothetical protein KKI08_17870 [Armatimonadetes bacterium]|nr:hypothetical protein [Armatimonadota bacterium]